MTVEEINSHKNQMTYFIANAIDEIIKGYWYDNIQDVTAYNIPGGKWQSEALTILEWNSSIWDSVQTYYDNLNEETIIGTDNFSQFIPNLAL